jgi:hypothetical protein
MAEVPLVEPRPRDRCTFRRPFAPNFKDCPAFEAVEYGVSDMSGKPLQAIVTCLHLRPGLRTPTGSAYPQCAIGGPAERVAFAAYHIDQ